MKVTELLESKALKGLEAVKNAGYRWTKINSRVAKEYPDMAEKFTHVIINSSLNADERSESGAGEKSWIQGTLTKHGVPAKFHGHMVFFTHPE